MDARDSTRWSLAPAGCAFLAGVTSVLALPVPPDVMLCAAVACTAVLALNARRFLGSGALVTACLGFLFATVHVQSQLRHTWPRETNGERARVSAVIDSIPEARGEDWSFDAVLTIEAPHPEAEELRARLLWRNAPARPHAGERWELLVSLRPPDAALNPGTLDQERLLFHDRIHALGTVVPSRSNGRVDDGHRWLAAVRERIALHIRERVDDREAAALIEALAVGATGAMSREQWRVFNATGTTHLVAISGLHVTLFALVAFAAARRLWTLLVWRWAAVTRDGFAAVVGIGASTAYACLAGLSIPTQRTLIMLAAWLFTRTMARASPPLQPLAIAVIVVLLLDPFAPLTAGFWLSFAAMGAILLVTQPRPARRGPVREAVVVQVAVTVMLVPLTLACFGSISLIGPVANAFAIPYMSWVLIPVVLASLLLLPIWPQASDLALSLAEGLHNVAWPWLAAAADSPLALVHASPPAWWYGLAIATAFIVLMPWPVRLRLAALVCVLPLLAAGHDPPAPEGMEVTALDTGEGMAVVLRTAHHTLLYGTGESYGTEGRRMENVVVPFLRGRGVVVLDRFAVPRLTPVTGDGVTALLAAMEVRLTLIGEPAVPDFPGAAGCESQPPWNWDGVRFEVLAGCGIRASSRHGEIDLAPGVIRLSQGAKPLWLIVPGRSERDGKVRSSVARLAAAGAPVLATANAGAIRVTVSASAGVGPPEGLRATHRAIWRRGPAPLPTMN